MRELRHRASTVVQSARALGRAGGRRQGDAETREDPELALAICYAPRKARAALAALFALDATLADVLRTTTEPMLGQMRLTWWHDALTRLEAAPPPDDRTGEGRGGKEWVSACRSGW